MVSFHRNRCWLLCFGFFYGNFSWMNATTCWYHIFHWEYFVGWSYYHFIYMMIPASIWITLMRNITLLFPFITNYWNTFGKISILTGSRQSKENKYLASYQFSLNQGYQNRTHIWKVFDVHIINKIKSWWY